MHFPFSHRIGSLVAMTSTPPENVLVQQIQAMPSLGAISSQDGKAGFVLVLKGVYTPSSSGENFDLEPKSILSKHTFI